MSLTAAIRPNASTALNAYWTLAGASSHAALADDSDSTYIEASTNGNASDAILSFPDPAVPAGGYPVGLFVLLRTKKVAGVNRYAAGTIKTNAVESYEVLYFQNLVTWTLPNAVQAGVLNGDRHEEFDLSAPKVNLSGQISRGVTFYEVWAYGIYVAQPVVTITGPTGTLTTLNRPPIAWTRDLDGLGGSPALYEAKLYDATTHGAFGSVNPDSTTPYHESGERVGGDTSWRPSIGLPDDDYRAYVRVAQTVNGESHWSDWDSIDFEIDVSLPAVPSVDLTPDNARANVEITIEENSGVVVTDSFEVEVSDDGVNWVDAKTLSGAGLVVNPNPGGPGTATLYEYFLGNGQTRHVRARALRDHGGGLTVASPWSAVETASWSSASWWLKHPTTPALNIAVRPFGLPGFTRPSRQGQFQGVGSRQTIVVSDYPGSPQGEITLWLDSTEEQTALDAILADPTPLLLQSPPGTHWQDRWISLSNQNRRPPVDKLEVLDSQDQLEWIEVEEPVSKITAWEV